MVVVGAVVGLVLKVFGQHAAVGSVVELEAVAVAAAVVVAVVGVVAERVAL